MSAGPGILIASTSAGTGHVHAAEAVRAALLERDPHARVEHVDVLRLAPSWVRALYSGGFELVASRAPWLWRELYQRTNGAHDVARWGAAARHLLFRAFQDVLSRGDWSAVLCTHFLPCQLAAGEPGAPPFALVVTDFTLHRYWVQPQVKRYFTATRALADDVRRRVRGVRADATGIPVNPFFLRALPRAAARVSLDLDPERPVALVMGGGMGVGVVESALGVLSADVPGLQVVAVTGHNERARARLSEQGLPPGRLRVFGQVDRVPDFMAAADVVVTKPGGLTISEALALGRPLLLTRGIPGHEDGNVRALVDTGAAEYAPHAGTLQRAVRRIFNSPRTLDTLAERARAVGQPHAARSIAGALRREFVLDLVA
ncbi:MAG: glycosyltransferase [Gemmatimonadota bacterium]